MAQTAVQKRVKLAADVSMAGIAVVIAYLTLFHTSGGTSGPPWMDKVYHAVAFAVLVFPGALAHRLAFLWLVPLAIGFGALIEYAQPYFGRSREIADLYADIVGVFGGIALGTFVRLWRKTG